MGPFSRLYYFSVCFANDMKHIHTHAIGNKFDRIHAICMEYYEKASDESDTFAEIALELDQRIENPSNSASLISYNTSNSDFYEWDEAITVIYERINKYISMLESVRNGNVSQDIQSLLDESIRYWKKENNYKNKMRMRDY